MPSTHRSIQACVDQRSVRLRSRGERPAHSLNCEQLENRCLLAVVTSLADSGLGSLRDTIALAPPGDTITFGVSGTISLTSGEILINKSLTIDASGPFGGESQPPLTVSGTATSRVFRIDDGVADGVTTVVLRSFTITQGRSSQDGGAILSYENLVLDQMVFTANEVTGVGQDGGAISHGQETHQAGDLTITGSSFSNNKALDDAGALDVYNAGDVSITDTTFDSNISGDSSGAGGNQGGYVGAIRIIDAVTAAYYGPKTVLLDNMDFTNNSVRSFSDDSTPQQLGGILISPGTGFLQTWDVTIRDSLISGNTHDVSDPAPGDTFYGLSRGAGLFTTDLKTLTIQDSTISNNRTALGIEACTFCRGGGAYLQDIGTLNISDSKITGNYSYTDGGGLMISGAVVDSTSTLNRVTISSNGQGPTGQTVTGAGLWAINFAAYKLNVTVNDSTITNNVGTFGAGITAQQGVNLMVNRSTISGNKGNRGSGVYILSFAQVNTALLDTVTIGSNVSTYGGGGVQISGDVGYEPTVTLRNSTISNNTAPGNKAAATYGLGGGINVDVGNLVIEQSTISGNSAVLQGGGISLTYYSKADISRSTITNNRSGGGEPDFAPGAGGGIFNASTINPVVLSNTIVAQNTVLGTGTGPDVNGPAAATFNTTSSFVGSTAGAATVNGAPLTGNAMLGGLGSGVVGPTATHLPLAGSPVINAGTGVRATDQRGLPGVVGGAVDVGSVEVQLALNLDFNNDGKYNCGDMDLLETNIDANTNVSTYDVNGDAALTKADVFEWLLDAGELRFGAGRFFRSGDANLDGVVDGTDFGIWNGNKFTTNRRWCGGDFNQDNATDGSDFGIWNGNKFTMSDNGRPGNLGVVSTSSVPRGIDGNLAAQRSPTSLPSIRLDPESVDTIIAQRAKSLVRPVSRRALAPV